MEVANIKKSTCSKSIGSKRSQDEQMRRCTRNTQSRNYGDRTSSSKEMIRHKKTESVSRSGGSKSINLKKSANEYHQGRSTCKYTSATELNKKAQPTTYDRNIKKDTEPLKAHCFSHQMSLKYEPCSYDFQWQRNKYVKDECGSGILQQIADRESSKKKLWCKTPLSMYQSTIGELGRKILCGESRIIKDVLPAPPCNVCQYVLPPCRGYYRKYDCLRPCEEEYAGEIRGQKTYRDPVERYWQPCTSDEDEIATSIRKYAARNAYLGEKVRRRFDNITPCW